MRASIQNYRPANKSRSLPPPVRFFGGPFQVVEYVFFFALFYGYIGEVVGVTVRMLGAGLILFLTVLCVLRPPARGIWNSALGVPMLFTASFLVTQKLHGESMGDGNVRGIVIWMMTVIIVSKLCSRRGFIQRYGFALLLTGAAALPFMSFSVDDRAGLTSVGGTALANANGLAMYFGFLAVLFTVGGLQARRGVSRILNLLLALSCLFIVGLTVSRSPIAGYAISLVISFRRQLRRAFVPLCLITVLAGVVLASGMADRVIEHYTNRGMEDSGRVELWPAGLAKYKQSPLFGYGVSGTGVYILNEDHTRAVHNTALWVALSSGIVPLIFFFGYWLMGLRGALKTSPQSPFYAYVLPLWAYALFEDQFTSLGFLEPWSIFAVSICLVQLIPNHPARNFRLLNRTSKSKSVLRPQPVTH
jgi:O-antigen ligase